jgi:two-component system response regulator RegA
MKSSALKLRKVLVVEDYEPFLRWLGRNTRDFDIAAATGPGEVWRIVEEHELYCAFIDVMLASSNGIDLVRPLLMLQPGLRIAMVTNWRKPEYERASHEAGAVMFLDKAALNVDRAVPELMKIPPPATIRCAPVRGLHRSLARSQREHIDAVLEDCGGNKSEAARRLGISRQRLRQLLAKPQPTS